jgi:ribosomal protein S18 acetylase RimI-like enzyme
MVQAILREGRRQGADHAYLQVVSDNSPARSVYEQNGFRELFCYWFRVKKV